MQRFAKITSYVLIALIFSVALSGCKKTTKENPKAKEIVVWSFEDEDVWKPIAKNFSTKYKGYTLTYQKQTFDSTYETRVLNSILSNQGPDVWNMPNDWVYRHKDKLIGMPKKTLNIDRYTPSISQSVVFGDTVYALSSYSEPLTIYYNSKLFDQTLSDFNKSNPGVEFAEDRKEAARVLKDIPNTWTDFVKAVNYITKIGEDGQLEIAGAALGTDKITNSADILYLLMLQNETKIVSDDLKQATFNLPSATPKATDDLPGLRALDFYTSFSDPSSENYSWDDALGNDIDAFASGKVGVIFGYSSLQNSLAQKYPNFKYKRATVPQLSSDASKIVDYARFNALGVSSLVAQYGSDKIKACWNLINMIANGQSTDTFNSAIKVYTSEKANGDVSLENRNSGNPDRASLLTAKSIVKGRYPVEFDRIIKNNIKSTLEGSLDSKTALDTAATQITDLLRKETW